MLRPRTVARLGVAALALALVACGGAGSATPAPAGPPTTASSSASPPAASADAGGWTAAGPSFGVDRAAWPTTVGEARTVVHRLPGSLGGQQKESGYSAASDEEGGSGAEVSVGYGEAISLTVSEEYVTTDTADGKPELMTARELLAVTFRLGLACAEDAYRGNALPLDPGAARKIPAGEPVWFSCAVDEAEGDEDFAAHAVGWTSGKTAWLVLAPDSDAVRTLVVALYGAAS